MSRTLLFQGFWGVIEQSFTAPTARQIDCFTHHST